MHKFKVLKLTNVSESAIPIFYKRKRYTKVLFNKMFFQKMGVGPEGPRKRKALAPILWKNILLKGTFVYRLRLQKMGMALSETFGSFNTLNLCMSEYFQLAKRLNSYLLDFHRFQKSESVLFFARAFCKKIKHMFFDLF